MKTTTLFSKDFQSNARYLKMHLVKSVLFCLCLVLIQYNLFGEIYSDAKGDVINSSKDLKNKYSSWKIVVTNPEIVVYERWIYLPENRKTRERKGIFYVTNEVDEIVDMVSQAEGIPLWMSGVKESKNLNSKGLNQHMIYIFFNVPWPFSDKDLVAKITLSDKATTTTTTINYSAVSDYLPLNEDADRLLSYEATWTITRMESGLTQVEFTVFSDTPPVAPRWIQDPVTIKLFKKNLLKLRELLVNSANNELNAMNQ